MLMTYSRALFLAWSSYVLLTGSTAQNSPPVFTGDPIEAYVQRFMNSLFNTSRAELQRRNQNSLVLHEWAVLEYDWPSVCLKDFYTERGRYNPESILLHGLDIYKDDVYVTLFRRDLAIPAGLNKIVQKNGKSLLQPFPSLIMNDVGVCSHIQFPVSTTTDPNTGLMYVLDAGDLRRWFPDDKTIPEAKDPCPPRLVVLDLNNNGMVVRSHAFPESIVPRATNAISELVLDYGNPNSEKVQYAYISDYGNGQLVVFDFTANTSWAFKHESMKYDENNVITINDVRYDINISINGIAMDPDSQVVYYCPIGSLKLSQIPTSVLRDPNGDFASNHRFVGNKLSQSDGIVYGEKSLFYGAESLNAVYKWEVSKDIETQETTAGRVTMETQTEVVRDNFQFQWVDALRLDNKGYLWFTTNKAHQGHGAAQDAELDFSGARGSNFRINRVFVGEKSYLHRDQGCGGTSCPLNLK